MATEFRSGVLRGALRLPGSKRYLTDTGLQHVMVVMRRISGAGRGLLVLGAALLLVSLFGVLILLLYAGLLYVAAYQFNQQAPGGDAAISIGYGFLTAMAACVLIEAGARLPSAVPVRPRVPAVSSGRRA